MHKWQIDSQSLLDSSGRHLNLFSNFKLYPVIKPARLATRALPQVTVACAHWCLVCSQ